MCADPLSPLLRLAAVCMQIFFACMCATLTLNLSRSAGKALIHSGSFGWFNQVRQEAGGEQGGASQNSSCVAQCAWC